MLIRLRSGEPFGFAGLWETWRGPEGPVETCTIVTTAPNAVTAPIHDRMPVILAPAGHGRWLDPAQPDAQALLRPYPDDRLKAFPVSTRVNSPQRLRVAEVSPLFQSAPPREGAMVGARVVAVGEGVSIRAPARGGDVAPRA